MYKKAAGVGVSLTLLVLPIVVSAQTACTMDAKQCPDGSWVGRSGSNCEFVCPGNSNAGGSGLITPAPTSAPNRCPHLTRTLARGSRGADVLRLQRYLGVSPTGYYGALTARLVGTFQSGQGLRPTGVVGVQTRSALSRQCAPGKPSPGSPSGNCTADSQCPANNTCEATQGVGTACSSTDPNCTPKFSITQGVCKVKSGYACNNSTDCVAGNLCHAGVCTSPLSGVCSYSGDPVCGADYQCIQDCGPPLSRGNEPPPGWHCVLNEQARKPRMCPICLASNTTIATPHGKLSVKEVLVGTKVWSQNSRGEKIATTVVRVSRTPVPTTHHVVHLVFNDGREVWASPNHPTVEGGRTVGDLKAGNWYEGAQIQKTESVSYWDSYTYDLLPNSDTGFYWANGVLLGSSLK